MQLVKKYANRKLYHTNRKQYITLDGIAQLLQHGEVVQVLDNESGHDITASTLAQVVLQARRGGSLLPTTVLAGVINAGGDTLASLRRSLLTSIGGLGVVNAEIERRIDALLAGGDISADDAGRMRRLLLGQPMPTLEQHALSNSNDVDRLKAQVDDLARTVEQLLLDRQHQE